MQKPDFEIVVECNPDYAAGPLLHGAAVAVAMQGAKYIKSHRDLSIPVNVVFDMHIQGWRERPEGWEKE